MKIEEIERPLFRLILLVLAAGVVAALFGDFDQGYPDEWDPRVVDLAAFVERARGLEFDHPVYVDFLPEQDFVEQVVNDDEPSEAQRTAADRNAGVLRSLGLISGPVDLLAENDTVASEGIAAFYSPSTKRITIRGDELTPLLRATIVHELTHTLQDQNFDLSRLSRAPTVAAQNAFRSLAEGDAVRIERAYVEALPGPERAEYDSGSVTQSDEVQLDESPQVLVALFAAPYTLGRPLLDLLEQVGGNERINQAFEKPPTTEEHLLDPFSFLASESMRDDLEIGDLPEGIESFEDGDFGTLLLYLMLAERLDPLVALAAVRGWNGDAYAAYEKDGAVCTVGVFAGDTTADANEIFEALTSWGEQMPSAPTVAIGDDELVRLTSCDPGPDVDLQLPNRSVEALDVPFLRGLVAAVTISENGADIAECVGQTVVASFTFAELSGPDSAIYLDGRFQDSIQSAVGTCQPI